MNKKVPCPFCGEEIDAKARVCRYCGSDEETGWSDSSYSDSMGPDEGFDYDELLEQEFGAEKPKGKKGKKKATLLRVASILMLVLFLLLFIKGLL